MSAANTSDQVHAIELSKNLGLTAAAPLMDSINGAQGQAITLDAANVETLGAQCLQVLLAASHSWASKGQSFQVISASDAFNQGLETLGFTPDTFSQTETL